jgi:hypothetical protein
MSFAFSFLADLKKRVEVKPRNIFTKVYMHWRHHMVGALQGALDVLVLMMRTGKYYPSCQWVDEKKGMTEIHANSLWALMTNAPGQVIVEEDVMAVFLATSSGSGLCKHI